eukprot:scaffold118409_cov60-Phaeocystis_antarctica.AAC.2
MKLGLWRAVEAAEGGQALGLALVRVREGPVLFALWEALWSCYWAVTGLLLGCCWAVTAQKPKASALAKYYFPLLTTWLLGIAKYSLLLARCVEQKNPVTASCLFLVKSPSPLRSSSFECAACRAGATEDGQGTIGISLHFGPSWPAQRPVHSRASRCSLLIQTEVSTHTGEPARSARPRVQLPAVLLGCALSPSRSPCACPVPTLCLPAHPPSTRAAYHHHL